MLTKFRQRQTFGRPTDWSNAAIPSKHAPKVDAASAGASITTLPARFTANPELREEIAHLAGRGHGGHRRADAIFTASSCDRETLATAKPCHREVRLSLRSPVIKHRMSALHIRDTAELVRHAIRMGINGLTFKKKRGDSGGFRVPRFKILVRSPRLGGTR